MMRAMLILVLLASSGGARAGEFFASAAGGVAVGTTSSVSGVVEAGTQDTVLGFSGDVHLGYVPQTQRNAYSAFVNARLQLPLPIVNPYAVAGLGLTNDVPMYTASAQPVWKVGGGVRLSPLPLVFFDAQAGLLSTAAKYFQLGVGVAL